MINDYHEFMLNLFGLDVFKGSLADIAEVRVCVLVSSKRFAIIPSSSFAHVVVV